jgi:dihydroneopterin aldolase
MEKSDPLKDTIHSKDKINKIIRTMRSHPLTDTLHYKDKINRSRNTTQSTASSLIDSRITKWENNQTMGSRPLKDTLHYKNEINRIIKGHI